MKSDTHEQLMNMMCQLIRVTLCTLALSPSPHFVRMRPIAFPVQPIRDDLRRGSDGPRFLHEIPVFVFEAVRTPMKRRLDECVSFEILNDLRISPALAIGGPFVANNPILQKDSISDFSERPEEATKFRTHSPKSSEGPKVSRFVVNTR